jgi:hypothetical protein
MREDETNLVEPLMAPQWACPAVLHLPHIFKGGCSLVQGFRTDLNLAVHQLQLASFLCPVYNFLISIVR